MMDWQKLLLQQRFKDEKYTEQAHRPIYLQDADRITFSSPFRRLANKTQVHPLYDHDHLHHRLIHSVETTSVGRSLGMMVGNWLEENKYVEQGQRHIISGVVQAACLAHDIGNPPFGHSGEAAIGGWFDDQFRKQRGLFGQIENKKRGEFIDFEGNAQGFKLLSRLEMYRNDGGMRLSYAVLSAFSKYPITAWVKSEISSSYCGAKKFGVFDSELDLWTDVAERTGLSREDHKAGSLWKRHPLVFLVEAADDICYTILDLEDACISGDIDHDVALEHLSELFPKPNRGGKSVTPEDLVAEHRARAIGGAIDACVEAFKGNYSQIMSGDFNGSLISASTLAEKFKKISALSKKKIYTARRKTELEVAGRNIIWKVLDGVIPIYECLGEQRWNPEKLDPYSVQLVRALNLDLREARDAYSALHSLADFVSGMTDRYAVRVARMVSGVST